MSTMISDHGGVLARCSSCGRTNRLRFANLDRTIRCGHCHTTLPSPAVPVEAASVDSFDAMIRDTSVPVVVDFWAPWCGPCRSMALELEIAARSLTGRALIVKLNTDDVPEVAERFRIRSIPTLAVFRHGREITRVAGVRPAAEIEGLVTRA
jgi:thioredoxin 2